MNKKTVVTCAYLGLAMAGPTVAGYYDANSLDLGNLENILTYGNLVLHTSAGAIGGIRNFWTGHKTYVGGSRDTMNGLVWGGITFITLTAVGATETLVGYNLGKLISN